VVKVAYQEETLLDTRKIGDLEVTMSGLAATTLAGASTELAPTRL
jgi:hypothetical protein